MGVGVQGVVGGVWVGVGVQGVVGDVWVGVGVQWGFRGAWVGVDVQWGVGGVCVDVVVQRPELRRQSPVSGREVLPRLHLRRQRCQQRDGVLRLRVFHYRKTSFSVLGAGSGTGTGVGSGAPEWVQLALSLLQLPVPPQPIRRLPPPDTSSPPHTFSVPRRAVTEAEGSGRDEVGRRMGQADGFRDEGGGRKHEGLLRPTPRDEAPRRLGPLSDSLESPRPLYPSPHPWARGL